MLLSTVILIATSVIGALGLLFVLRHWWGPTKLRKTNDATISCLTVVGTIYAVILTFMLSSVWEDFKEAELNTEQEAGTIAEVFQLAGGLADPLKTEGQDLARSYERVVVGEEWDAMARERISPQARDCVERIMLAVTRAGESAGTRQVTLTHLLTAVTRVGEHRRAREVQGRTALPGVLWVVLILGGVITVGNSCLLGVENVRLHLLIIVTLTCFVTLMLVAIAEIDRPFQGNIRVRPDSFETALAAFDRLQGF